MLLLALLLLLLLLVLRPCLRKQVVLLQELLLLRGQHHTHWSGARRGLTGCRRLLHSLRLLLLLLGLRPLCLQLLLGLHLGCSLYVACSVGRKHWELLLLLLWLLLLLLDGVAGELLLWLLKA